MYINIHFDTPSCIKLFKDVLNCLEYFIFRCRMYIIYCNFLIYNHLHHILLLASNKMVTKLYKNPSHLWKLR